LSLREDVDPSESLPFAIYCLHKLWQAVASEKKPLKLQAEKLGLIW